MEVVTLAVVVALLMGPATAARRSAATQAVVKQCTSLGEAPMQEKDVYLYDELYYASQNPFIWKDCEPIPFDKMRPSMLFPAACELVQDLHAGLDELESETSATWNRIVKPLELLYDSYERVTGVFELLAKVARTPAMETAVSRGAALASGFSRRLQQSTALHASLCRIRNHRTAWTRHSSSQLRALDHWLVKMSQGGVHLANDTAKVARFNRLDEEEAELRRRFVRNVVQGTAAFHLTMRDGELLRGVPHSTLEDMAAAAQARKFNFTTGWTWAVQPASDASPVSGTAPTPEWGPWTVTLDPYVYSSMMAYCPNRRLRQVIHQSYESRASQAPWNNVPVVERLLQVRRSRARLLGATSYAELVSRTRMASPDQANSLLDTILAPVASAALRTLLSMLRLVAECDRRGEDVWGDGDESRDLSSMSMTAQRAALGRRSKVSYLADVPYAFREPNAVVQVRNWGVMYNKIPPRVSLKALDEAELALNKKSLSQADCVALLANITPHFRDWDVSYWARRLMASRGSQEAGAAPEAFSTYFTLSRVLSSAFGLVYRLWGVHVEESVDDKPPVWHPDVRHFKLLNGTEFLGCFYFDPFARPGKLGNSFTHNLVKRSKTHGYFPRKYRAPVVAVSTSIRPPKSGEPELQFNDFLAVFHELGHVLEILLNRDTEVLIAGSTTLPLDFSEMFSQFFESWATEECVNLLCNQAATEAGAFKKNALLMFPLECSYTLSTIAQSSKTHVMLTADRRRELVQDVRSMRPLMMLQQLYLSRMDLSLHSTYTATATDRVLNHRQKVAGTTLLLPYSSNNCDFCALISCFGYEHGSNLYSYLWSEIYSADAMGYVMERGNLNDTVVRALGNRIADKLLSRGMQSNVKVQYEKFRGRPVSTRYFLKQLRQH